ncbi:MAG: hypothetical protein DRH32_07860 [Deltaproteobacteria bacterium]|nr:MAG: hypothetical protein DRH32_07860 [Deltaproteobacteria bacterium]
MFQNATELKKKKEIIVRVGQRIALLQKRTRVLQKSFSLPLYEKQLIDHFNPLRIGSGTK